MSRASHRSSACRLRPGALCLAALAIGGFVLAIAIPAAAHTTAPPASNRAAEARKMTDVLTALAARYRAATPGIRASLESQLLTAASVRQSFLASLIEDDPDAVLQAALPALARSRLPTILTPYLEQEIQVEGSVFVVHEHRESGNRYRYFVDSVAGHRELSLRGSPRRDLLSGARVQLKAVAIGNTLALAADGSDVQQVAPGAQPFTFGGQRILLMLVNFQDAPTQPYTPASAHDLVFGSTSAFFIENSYQQSWLEGDVVGWLTIPLSSTVCDFNTLAVQAGQAAAAAGVAVADYSHLAYAFPKNACTGLAWATIGGYPSQAWFNGDFDMPAVAHELGHNLGLYHSHALDCGTVTEGGACTTFEYGDPFDAMANSSPGHFNAFQKERLAWLSAGTSAVVKTVTASGTFTVGSYETSGTQPRALKILKAIDPATGLRTWYYVESRQAIGFDSFLAGNGNMLNGVLVHTGSESSGDSSNILDLTPGSGLLNVQDWADPALVAGQTFTDPVAGVTIKAESVTPIDATITVVLTAPVPVPTSGPTVTVSTDKASYTRGQTVSISAKALANGAPVARKSIAFAIRRSDGSSLTASATTGTNGTAIYKLRLRKQDPVGMYSVSATISGGAPTSVPATFAVQ